MYEGLLIKYQTCIVCQRHEIQSKEGEILNPACRFPSEENVERSNFNHNDNLNSQNQNQTNTRQTFQNYQTIKVTWLIPNNYK